MEVTPTVLSIASLVVTDFTMPHALELKDMANVENNEIVDTLRQVLSADWNVDFNDRENTLWEHVAGFSDDGYGQIHVLSVDRNAKFGDTFRVYRAFSSVGGRTNVSVDLEMSSSELADTVFDNFAFDNGERGDVEFWRDALARDLGGDVRFLWHHADSADFDFVARTVRVGGDERVVSGSCRISGPQVSVSVDMDVPLDMLAQPVASPRKSAAFGR